MIKLEIHGKSFMLRTRESSPKTWSSPFSGLHYRVSSLRCPLSKSKCAAPTKPCRRQRAHAQLVITKLTSGGKHGSVVIALHLLLWALFSGWFAVRWKFHSPVAHVFPTQRKYAFFFQIWASLFMARSSNWMTGEKLEKCTSSAWWWSETSWLTCCSVCSEYELLQWIFLLDLISLSVGSWCWFEGDNGAFQRG